MTDTLETVRTVADLRDRIAAWRRQGLTIGLVPTMGALHDGHLSLVDQSIAGTDRTIVTLFINPRQFGPDEDFEVYPRDEGEDAGLLQARGAHLLFAPTVQEMYREGAVTTVSVPGIGDILDGACRPGFFTGVATVVAKLLIQSLPDRAFFGEKDYQQLRVVTRMARDLDLPVEIVGCAIVREADGLAMSSRNAYLTAAERKTAAELYQVLETAAREITGGADISPTLATARSALQDAGFGPIDYISLCDSQSLEELAQLTSPARLLAAAWLGQTRLIDNLPVEPEG